MTIIWELQILIPKNQGLYLTVYYISRVSQASLYSFDSMKKHTSKFSDFKRLGGDSAPIFGIIELLVRANCNS